MCRAASVEAMGVEGVCGVGVGHVYRGLLTVSQNYNPTFLSEFRAGCEKIEYDTFSVPHA